MKYVMVLLAVMFSGLVQAETVFSCTTPDEHKIQLTRDTKEDTFTLVYGKDLTHPEIKETKTANSMGYSFNHSSGNNMDDFSVYMDTPSGYITVGVTDYADNGVDGYFSVEKPPEQFIISDACINATINETFRAANTTVFEHMTYIDDY